MRRADDGERAEWDAIALGIAGILVRAEDWIEAEEGAWLDRWEKVEGALEVDGLLDGATECRANSLTQEESLHLCADHWTVESRELLVGVQASDQLVRAGQDGQLHVLEKNVLEQLRRMEDTVGGRLDILLVGQHHLRRRGWRVDSPLRVCHEAGDVVGFKHFCG